MLSETEADVMQLLMEDDYGLWEIAWRLGDLEVAIPVVESLCRLGLADISIRDWVDAPPVRLARPGHQIDLRDPNCWEEPTAGRPHFLLTATDAAREASEG